MKSLTEAQIRALLEIAWEEGYVSEYVDADGDPRAPYEKDLIERDQLFDELIKGC